MSPSERWQQIDDLFDAALELPAAERPGFLARACGGDAALICEVSALLASAGEAERVLGESATAFAAPLLASGDAELDEADLEPLPPGQRVGPYRLLDEIGRGGMGAVYRAERADGAYEQRVALKLVKRGMDTDEILRRFRHERQILASLEHPHIARLLDGGAAEDGRPYLVMELVEGEPIDAYCERNRLGIEARLALFGVVCEAVQHAHQNLVVHRDLKPSNILVAEPAGGGAGGTPKLLDFGIAKLLEEDAAAAPHTRTGLRMLTPAYASPEQLRGAPLTTASDVYALGVLLHLLLTGQRPRDGARPSDVAPERLRRRLRGDLDVVMLKAIEPDPARRYPSAGALADDVERHLAGLPIEARRASTAYLASRFVARHSAGVAVAVLLLVLLVGFGAAMTLQQRQTAAERDLARLEADKAQATLDFVTGLFEGADPDRMQGDTLNVFQLLERGTTRLDGELEHHPAVRVALMNALGTLYSTLGDYQAALPLLEGALQARRELGGPDGEDVAGILRDLARLRGRQGEYDVADSLFAASLAIRARDADTRSTAVPETLNQWAEMLVYIGRYADAEPKLDRAITLLEARPGDQRAGIARARFGQAKLLSFAGDYDRAEALYRQVLATRLELHGELHTDVVHSLSDMGDLLFRRGQYAAAEPFMREALALRRRLLGDRHPDVSLSLNNLGTVMTRLGGYAEADTLLAESLVIKERLLGREHRDIAITLLNIGFLHLTLGDLAAAERAIRESVGIMRRTSGPRSADAGVALARLATVLQRRGAFAEAESLSREALGIRIAVHGEQSMPVAWQRTELARLLHEVGRLDEAERLHRQSLELRLRLQGDDHREPAIGMAALAGLLLDRARHAEAESLLLRAHRILRASPAATPDDRRAVVDQLIALYGAWGRPAEQARYRALREEMRAL